MTAAGVSNLLGFLFTAIGSLIGVIGAIMLANNYLSFPPRRFLRMSLDLILELLFHGWSGARTYLETAVGFAALKEEDKFISLTGLCCVFYGFGFQLVGAALLYAGTLLDKPK